MKELKGFNVLSVGKVFGLFGFVVSFIQMIFLKLISTTNAALQYRISAADLTLGIMVKGILVATAVYFIGGLIVALIYNLVAKYVGGIMLDLSDVAKKKTKKTKKK